MSSTPPPPPPPPPPPGAFVTPPVASPAGQPIADAWMRIVARLLDGVISAIVAAIIFGIVVGTSGNGLNAYNADDASVGAVFLAIALTIGFGFLYDPVMTKLKGGTPMKLAFKMRVVRADNGGPVEWSHVLIRWGIVAIWNFVPFLSVLVPLVLVIVSLVFLFTKPLRQAVWDQVAKTLVVKTA